MENYQEQQEQKLVVSAQINSYLMETSKWGKFLAIMGYIGMGIMVLVAIVMMFNFSSFNPVSETGFPSGIVVVLYLIIALLYYFPVTYLYRFSMQIKQSLQSNDINTFTSGFENLKSLFKFIGVLTIVILSIYGMILLISIPAIMLLK